MKILLFDASIHFGQFLINNEEMRIACKNSQAQIAKHNTISKAYYTYFENGRMDKVIRSLDRSVQDAYYPFMDVFYSDPSISGLADTIEEMSFATMIASKFPNLSSSNAISCALAVTRRVDEVHTLYLSMLDHKLTEYLLTTYGIQVTLPPTGVDELVFESKGIDLEKLYKESLASFKKNKVHLTDMLHDKPLLD